MLMSTSNEITLVAKTTKVLYATVDRPERKLNLGGSLQTSESRSGTLGSIQAKQSGDGMGCMQSPRAS